MVSRVARRLASLIRLPELITRAAGEQQQAGDRQLRELKQLKELLQEQQHAARERDASMVHELRLLNRRLARQEQRFASADALRASGIDLAQAFGAPDIGPHVERAIANAQLERDPMPHLVIHDLLPEPTYAAIIGGLPAEVCFSDRDKVKRNMRLEQADGAPEWTVRMLTFLEHTLIPKMMVPALMGKFGGHVEEVYADRFDRERAGALARLPHGPSAGRLMLRRPGYNLDPHIDPKRVVITTLLYFARPGDDETFGTTLYRMQGAPVWDQTNTLYPHEQGIACELVKTAPFRPNTAVSFLNHGGAHGAGIPKSAPKDTLRYAYQFYVSAEPTASNALSF